MKSSFIFILLVFFSSLWAKDVKYAAFYTKNLVKVSDKDVQAVIRNILDEQEKYSNIKLKEEFVTSIDGMIDGFISQKYALISLNTYDVLNNHPKLHPYVDKIWTITKDINSSKQRYYIVIQNKTSVTTLQDVQKGVVATLRFDNMQKMFLETYLLEHFHQDTQHFFREHLTFSNANKELLKLFFGKIDACVVSEHSWRIATELNPQLKKRLKIVAKSPDIFPSISLTLIRKNETEVKQLYERFTKDAQSIKNITRLLLIYKAQGVKEFKKEDFHMLSDYYQHYLQLKKRYE